MLFNFFNFLVSAYSNLGQLQHFTLYFHVFTLSFPNRSVYLLQIKYLITCLGS